MKEIKGKVISLEGPDGAGKSTQAMLLKENLEKEGHMVKVMHFPRYESPIGAFIGNVLSSDVEIDFEALQCLYIVDQMDYQKDLDEFINKGGVVIFDRYDLSTLAYWKAKTGILTSVLMEDVYGNLQFKLRKPDLTIVFDRDGSLAERRDSVTFDRLESDKTITSSINKAYLELATRIGGLREVGIVDANLSIEEVCKNIMLKVKEIV